METNLGIIEDVLRTLSKWCINTCNLQLVLKIYDAFPTCFRKNIMEYVKFEQSFKFSSYISIESSFYELN